MATTDLVDLNTELKPFLGIQQGDWREDARLTTLNDIARSLIEDYLDRHIVSRGSITEYHTVRPASAELYTRQFPLLTITSIHEDDSRAFGATSLLTVNTDYIVSAPFGRILRISGSLPTVWLTTWRSVKIVYTAGYATTAVVDASLKHAALRTIALLWNELKREEIGYSSISDAQGNISRLVPGGLNQDVKRAIYCFRRMDQNPTGEVDA